MRQFCPGTYPLKYKIKNRLKNVPVYDYKFYPWPSIKMNIMDKIFKKLHYLGSHSYLTKKWHKHEIKLLKQHPKRF